MLEGLRARWFFSKVAAELKGQVREQRVVNALLVSPSALQAIENVRTDEAYLYVAGPKLLPYLGACEALAAIMSDVRSTREDRLLAASFLFTRLDRAEALSGPVIEGMRRRYKEFMDPATGR